jgi:16S rRNA (guanine527-N7)-methyltransferase
MPVLLEYCLPLVKPNGTFLAMKGGSEEPDYKRALAELSGKEIKVLSLSLTQNGAEGEETAARKIYCIKKKGPTAAKYPRKAGTASKQPL